MQSITSFFLILFLLVATVAPSFLLVTSTFTPTAINPIPTPTSTDPITLHLVLAPDDTPVARAACDRFTALHPHITVEFITFPHSSSDILTYYQDKYFSSHSTDIDLVTLDVVYPGTLSEYLLDLNQYNMHLTAEQFNPDVISNAKLDGKLISLPLYTDFGLLYYRKDLLLKYNYTSPPKTWDELANMSRVIVAGEQAASGNYILQGYTFQGAAYEGLTCHAMEWIDSYGGGRVVEQDAVTGKISITINNQHAVSAIDTLASWIGTSVSAVSNLDAQEFQSAQLFMNGNAVFHRNWPYMYHDLLTSPIAGKYQSAYLPSSNSSVRGSGSLGGWSFGINRYSKYPEWSALLLAYMVSPTELFLRGQKGQIPPVLPGVIPNATQMCNISQPSFCDLPSPAIVPRPSTIAGAKYGAVSQLIYRGVNDVLLGRYNATKLVQQLECEIGSLLDIVIERCQEGIAVPYSQSNEETQAIVAISSLLLSFTFLLTLLTYLCRHHHIMKASSPHFLGIMLLGVMLGYGGVITLVQYEPTKQVCQAQPMLAHIAFTLIFGSLFLKTYRLHIIFNATKLEIVQMSNMQLLIKQAIIIAATVIYLAIWLAVDSPTPTLTTSLNTSYMVCHSQQSYWPNLILVVEGLSVAYGCYLCLCVRSIPSLFNESTYVAVSIYNLAVFGTITLLITKIAMTQYDKAVLFETISILIVLLVTTCSIFIPKFWMIFTGAGLSNPDFTRGNETRGDDSSLSTATKGENSNGTALTAFKGSQSNNTPTVLASTIGSQGTTAAGGGVGGATAATNQRHNYGRTLSSTRLSIGGAVQRNSLSHNTLGQQGKLSGTITSTDQHRTDALQALISQLQLENQELKRLLAANGLTHIPTTTPTQNTATATSVHPAPVEEEQQQQQQVHQEHADSSPPTFSLPTQSESTTIHNEPQVIITPAPAAASSSADVVPIDPSSIVLVSASPEEQICPTTPSQQQQKNGNIEEED